MINIENKISEEMLPLSPLRGVVGFPGVQLNLEIVRPASLKAFTAAATIHDMQVLLVTQKDISAEEHSAEDLFKIGVLAKIRHVVKNTQNNLSVVFEGIARAKIKFFVVIPSVHSQCAQYWCSDASVRFEAFG